MKKGHPEYRSQSYMTATPDKYPQGRFRFKPCKNCQEEFQPVAPSHLYCSDKCKDFGLAENYYRKVYGIGYQEVLDMLEAQNNLCAICQEVGFKMHSGIDSPLNVDHDHNTGKVRGLLCHNCNRALGLMKDNTEWLRRSISYLEGATTIPQGSTYKCTEARDTQKSDDIVWSTKELVAAKADKD